MRGPSSEHTWFFERACVEAGIPERALDTYTARVPLGPVLEGRGHMPVPFTEALALRARSFAVGELASLPDFSYSLWDWAAGNEDCPVVPWYDDAAECHSFTSHMGAVNSNHFPPQSAQHYERLHAIALARARECAAVRSRALRGDPRADERFEHLFAECETEALAIEATAQHYLQDTWSSGHLWERWGGPDLSDFPDLAHLCGEGYAPRCTRWLALAVGAISGTVHGHQALSGLCDLMCCPDGVFGAAEYVHADGSIASAAGDLHYVPVVTGTALGEQRERMLACAGAGVYDVYRLLEVDGRPPILGARSPLVRPLPTGVEPFGPECTAQRATNRSMAAGASPFPENAFTTLPGSLSENVIRAALTVTSIAIVDSVVGDAVLSSVGADRMHADMIELLTVGLIEQATNPNGTNLAALEDSGGEVISMLGVDRNRAHARGGMDPTDARLSSYQDPLLPWPGSTDPHTPDALGRAETLALFFHRGHAADWCRRTTAEDLAALRARVEETRDGSPSEHEAACELCAEVVSRHLRIGEGAMDYATEAEPFCHHFPPSAGTPTYVYHRRAGLSRGRLARNYCGCEGLVAVTNQGVVRVATDAEARGTGTFEWPVLRRLEGAPVPVGRLPREAVVASGGLVLVSNADGEIVGVRDGREVDLDGDLDNGVTRLTFPGVTALQGLAIAELRGREWLLAAAVNTDELIVYDLAERTVCDRVPVAGATPGSLEPFGVVVDHLRNQAFVSLRGSPLTERGALATVDLALATTCTGAGERATVIPPPNLSSLGPLAISPDGRYLAIGGRLRSTCPDTVRNASASGTIEVQVGCDGIFIMEIATGTFRSFGARPWLPTRPGRSPYGIAFFPDSRRIAYTTFSGPVVDPWPQRLSESIGQAATLRLADVEEEVFAGSGGGTLRHWTYNLHLRGPSVGPNVVISADGRWVYVGTGDGAGTLSAFPVQPRDGSLDRFWEELDADPETALHVATGGTWYGGCRDTCSLPGGFCTRACPLDGATAPLHPSRSTYITLGAQIRALIAY
jgi:hypothetical protein